MSYDIYLDIHTGKDFKTIAEVGNYTSNVSPMWAKALGSPLKNLDGLKASDAIQLLRPAVKHMSLHADEYTPMNPDNGWGDYEGAFNYLKKLLHECEENPECILVISC